MGSKFVTFCRADTRLKGANAHIKNKYEIQKGKIKY